MKEEAEAKALKDQMKKSLDKKLAQKNAKSEAEAGSIEQTEEDMKKAKDEIKARKAEMMAFEVESSPLSRRALFKSNVAGGAFTAPAMPPAMPPASSSSAVTA